MRVTCSIRDSLTRIALVAILAWTASCRPGPSGGAGLAAKHAYRPSIDVSPADDAIIFSTIDDGALGELSLESGKVRFISLENNLRTETPRYSPNGKFILFAAYAKGERGSSIYSLNTKTNQLLRITTEKGVADTSPAYSPDGSKIVFARYHRHRRYSLGGYKWDNADIYVIDNDGANLIRVTTEKFYDIMSPRFMPDGKSILFSPGGYPGPDDDNIYLVEAQEDGKLTALFNPAKTSEAYVLGYDADCDLQSDKIVFISDRQKGDWYDVMITDTQGKKPRSLGVTASGLRYSFSPVFANGGQSIYFLTDPKVDPKKEARNCQIMCVEADGSDLRKIAEPNTFYRYRNTDNDGGVKPVKND